MQMNDEGEITMKKKILALTLAAADTLSDVRKAMKINYFDDAELINEQVKRFNK